MRNRLFVRVFIVACFVAFAAAYGHARQAAGDEFSGQWTGTWEGAGEGKFELVLQKGKDGMTGKVAVTTDGGNYEADLKGAAVAGKDLKATYDFPLDPSAEVAMSASFDGGKAKGTWSLRPKGGGAEVAGGTFALAKK